MEHATVVRRGLLGGLLGTGHCLPVPAAGGLDAGAQQPWQHPAGLETGGLVAVAQGGVVLAPVAAVFRPPEISHSDRVAAATNWSRHSAAFPGRPCFS